MKIYRKINGTSVEIELTGNELYSAFEYVRREMDKENIDYYLEEYDETPGRFEEEFGMSLETFRAECMGTAAEFLRKGIWDYEDTSSYLWDVGENAIRDAVANYLATRKSA